MLLRRLATRGLQFVGRRTSGLSGGPQGGSSRTEQVRDLLASAWKHNQPLRMLHLYKSLASSQHSRASPPAMGSDVPALLLVTVAMVSPPAEGQAGAGEREPNGSGRAEGGHLGGGGVLPRHLGLAGPSHGPQDPEVTSLSVSVCLSLFASVSVSVSVSRSLARLLSLSLSLFLSP